MARNAKNDPTDIKRLTEASYLLKPLSNLKGTLIGEIEVRSGEQTHLELGIHEESEHLKGFVIEFSPEPQDEDGIVAHITRLDKTNGTYKLILHIANYDTKTICAEVRQL